MRPLTILEKAAKRAYALCQKTAEANQELRLHQKPPKLRPEADHAEK